MSKQMKIGILSSGGDCPGINATIRSVGKAAMTYGMEVIGILDGFSGLLFHDHIQLDEQKLSGILTLGGTILGTSRENPFKKKEGDLIIILILLSNFRAAKVGIIPISAKVFQSFLRGCKTLSCVE